ncbi:tRNA 2-selenouridine synthase [Caldimonas thermodepolymerans]|jgi:tRNA 2-selenouridine synthase|nr:tRNA 2-selenouridine synthase [Caldimonas thermodepolymerans]
MPVRIPVTTGRSDNHGMSQDPVPDDQTPHPGQLGVQEFAQYARVIDARSPHEYEEDHIPGAINLPVVDDAEYAEVGTLHRTDPHAAYLIGSQYALRNIARHVGEVIARHRPSDRLLVYCFRGGKRSRIWAETLRTIGFRVDVLPGGWKNYRRWVRESLEQLPARLRFQVISGPTGCGKTRLLHALRDQGAQVLDLEGLAHHRGSLLGALPGDPQPSQKWFDSQLLDVLRRFDPARPVWVEAESKKIGNLQLPQALHDAMHRTVPLQVLAPMAARVQLLKEDYPHYAADPLAMVARLQPLKPLVGGEELARWQALAEQHRVDELFERVMVAHYDPCYARSTRRHYAQDDGAPPFELKGLDADSLAEAARTLMTRSER